MISRLCSVDKGAFIMLKRFLPSTLSHCNGHFGVEAVFYSDVSLASHLLCQKCMLPLSAELRLIARECSWFMKTRLAFIPASCEQMHGCISIKNLGGPAVTLCQCRFFTAPWFHKGRTPHIQWRLFTFSYVVVTHRASDSAKMLE